MQANRVIHHLSEYKSLEAKGKSVRSIASFSFAARERRLTANELSVLTHGAMSRLPERHGLVSTVTNPIRYNSKLIAEQLEYRDYPLKIYK